MILLFLPKKMEQQEYYTNYQHTLLNSLTNLCVEQKRLSRGVLPETIDITEKWDVIAPSYISDASKEIAKYPAVSLGWAMYLGMAVAKYWDTDWAIYGKHPNIYEHIRNKRGFDYLDEVVRGEILGLEGDEYQKTEDFVLSCSRLALDKIRHEGIEPSTPAAFFVYTLSCKVLYTIGAAVELLRLGYKMEKV
jgi:hypothetical protein